VPFINVSAPSIVSGMSGESEKTLRETFDEAKVRVPLRSLRSLINREIQRVAPCLLFIDEIDAIMGKRESAQREMERRIVAQFLTCMDGKPMSMVTCQYSTLTQICLGTRQATSLSSS
jgi:ribosome biogenesis ATPase